MKTHFLIVKPCSQSVSFQSVVQTNVMMRLLINCILLAAANKVYASWGCFKVTGMIRCGKDEYQQARVELFDHDGLLKGKIKF